MSAKRTAKMPLLLRLVTIAVLSLVAPRAADAAASASASPSVPDGPVVTVPVGVDAYMTLPVPRGGTTTPAAAGGTPYGNANTDAAR
jgi:hypothetical protein